MALFAQSWSTLRFHLPDEHENRADALRELADWSITSAELDWEHAERVDERGWGDH
jgi:hypothetical protein